MFHVTPVCFREAFPWHPQTQTLFQQVYPDSNVLAIVQLFFFQPPKQLTILSHAHQHFKLNDNLIEEKECETF